MYITPSPICIVYSLDEEKEEQKQYDKEHSAYARVQRRMNNVLRELKGELTRSLHPMMN